MGKSLIQQARGRGGPAYRVRRQAFRYCISYPPLHAEGKAVVRKLVNSPAHTAPLAEVEVAFEDKTLDENNKEIITQKKMKFIIPAAERLYEGQEIFIGKRPENRKSEVGDIIAVKDIPQGSKVFNVEKVPGRGGVFLRTAGSSGIIMNKSNGKVELIIKRRVLLVHENARACIGVISGDGKTLKPIVKAGKNFHRMKAIGRKWHRTSAVKMNAVDHPFGGGRGKRIKSKIAKRNAPAGAKVGHIRPRRTGRKK